MWSDKLIRPQSSNVTTCRCLAGTSIDTVSKAGKHDFKIGTSKSGQTKTNGLSELFLPIVGSEDIIERASCVCGPAGQDIGSKRCPRKCAGPGGAMSGLLLISRIACWSRVVLPIRRHPITLAKNQRLRSSIRSNSASCSLRL